MSLVFVIKVTTVMIYYICRLYIKDFKGDSVIFSHTPESQHQDFPGFSFDARRHEFGCENKTQISDEIRIMSHHPSYTQQARQAGR